MAENVISKIKIEEVEYNLRDEETYALTVANTEAIAEITAIPDSEIIALFSS